MDTMDMALRLGLALAIGAILGLDRDLARKPAGVRTHALVAIGSSLMVMAAASLVRDEAAMSRVLQGVITGIGFLGAGVILHHEAERRIEGLTTAASIWVAAALGAVCGAGLRELAALGLAASLFVLIAGGPLERIVERLFRREPGDPPRG